MQVFTSKHWKRIDFVFYSISYNLFHKVYWLWFFLFFRNFVILLTRIHSYNMKWTCIEGLFYKHKRSRWNYLLVLYVNKWNKKKHCIRVNKISFRVDYTPQMLMYLNSERMKRKWKYFPIAWNATRIYAFVSF